MEYENWSKLTLEAKQDYLDTCLSELVAISDGTHPLSNTPQQGRLSGIRQNLDKQVFNVIKWENDTD